MSKRMRPDGYCMTGFAILAVVITFCVIGGALDPGDPFATDPMMKLTAPGRNYLMGTDDVGRDLFSRLILGVRTSLFIGIVVTAVSSLAGTAMGIAAAYFPKTDKYITGIINGIMAFPTIIIAISLAGILGAGMPNIIVALSISFTPMIARVARSSTQEVLSLEYMEYIQVLGKSHGYIILRYILPNIAGNLIVQITYTFAMAILHESILSFLGVGIKVPMPSLGGMVSDGRSYTSIAPWIITFPGLTISLLVLALNLMGDGLRRTLDPQAERGN